MNIWLFKNRIFQVCLIENIPKYKIKFIKGEPILGLKGEDLVQLTYRCLSK